MNSLKEDSTFGLDGGGVMKSYSQDGEKSFSRLRRKFRRYVNTAGYDNRRI